MADDLRRETAAALRRASVAERVRLAFELGDAGLQAFAAARGLSGAEARRLAERRRQAGRRRSSCMRALSA